MVTLSPLAPFAAMPSAAATRGQASARRLSTGVFTLGLLLVPLLLGPRPAAAGMLDTVKQNPVLARNLCEEFKQLNASGQSATSKEAIARVAASQGLSTLDAEVFTTYVIGLYCPDVR